jgi:hypothetical protein
MKKLVYFATALFLSSAGSALASEVSADAGSMSDFAFPASAMNPYGAHMTEGQMEDARGGTDTAIITQMQATSSNNTIISGPTGFNTIGEGAFGSASGLMNIVQNSGNGVIIQNSMTVNLSMQ